MKRKSFAVALLEDLILVILLAVFSLIALQACAQPADSPPALGAPVSDPASPQPADPTPTPPPAVSVNTLGSLLDHFSPLTEATNYTIAPYFTYAPDAPEQFGGGVLVIYNVNNYVGAGLGVDYLGQFTMTSGNVSLRYPIRIGERITVTPFALGAIATPMGGAGGANGGVSTIEGAGVSIHTPWKLFGGEIGVGFAYMNWTDAGAYSGGHDEIFLTWQAKF